MKNNKVVKFLFNMDLFISTISLMILVITTFLGVIMRYYFNDPFVWLQEVQLWCFVWVVFFGGGTAFRSGSHVAIEVLVDRMRPNVKKYVELFGYLIFMFVLLYFLIQGMNLIKQLIHTERTTNILDIPYPIIYAAFPIGCILMIINYSIIMIKLLFLKKDSLQGGE